MRERWRTRLDETLECLDLCCCVPFELHAMVHQVTFPVPERPLDFYEDDLLPSKELLWLCMNPSRKRNQIPKGTQCIPALYIKSDPDKQAEFTMIYSHGNAEDICQEQRFVRDLSVKSGIDILLFEYPGYSLSRFTSHDVKNSPVEPNQKNINKAVEAAYRFLVNDSGIDPSRILIYGRSIGSGPALHLASRSKLKGVRPELSPQHVAGVFLVSPFLSTIRAVLGWKTARGCFCFDKFPNYRNVKNVNTHIAIMHARDDDIVKFWNGESLYEKFKLKEFQPLWLEWGAHNEIQGKWILDYLNKFTKFLLSKRPTNVSLRETLETVKTEKAVAFVPTRVAQPALKDWSPEKGETYIESHYVLPEETSGSRPVRPLTKGQIRMRRIQAIKMRLSGRD